MDALRTAVLARRAEAVRLRREIHRNPGLGFDVEETARLVERTLGRAGVPTRRSAKTGVVALVRGAKPGPTILFRADMDGLPIEEATGLPYRSRRAGAMHA